MQENGGYAFTPGSGLSLDDLCGELILSRLYCAIDSTRRSLAEISVVGRKFYFETIEDGAVLFEIQRQIGLETQYVLHQTGQREFRLTTKIFHDQDRIDNPLSPMITGETISGEIKGR